MLFKHALSLLVAFAASNVIVSAAAAAATTSCSPDNCLRAVQGSAYPTRHGTADCSSYFQATVTPATVTVTATVSQTTSTTTSGTETDLTTSTSISSSSVTEVSKFTVLITSTSTYTSTIYPPQYFGKRAAGLGGHLPLISKRQETNAPSSIPAYASPCSGAVRYSSACSCIGATKTTITAVAPTTTVTVTQTSTDVFTSSTTTTVVIPTTISTTVTFETSTTTTESGVATVSTSALATPTCSTIQGGSFSYQIVYAGFQTLNPNNPGNNPGAPPISVEYPGKDSICVAASACIQFAGNAFSPIGGGYFTINLQFVDPTQSWYCIAYYDQASAAYYNFNEPGVSQSYGWIYNP